MDTLKPSLVLFCCLYLMSCYLGCAADETNISSHNSSNSMCIEHERQALLKFKQGIRVDRCGLLSSWGDDRNCCQWHGVGCSNITAHVIILNLSGSVFEYTDPEDMCLQGELGSSLGELKHLRHLDLSFVNFEDQPIPSNIGSLVNLRYLNLSNSFSQGEIPPQLGNLSNLVSLDLTSGYIYPAPYVKSLSWISHLSMLRSITLSRVNLSEATNWQQVLNNLPFLRFVDLSFCSLPSLAARPLSYRNSSTTLSFLNLVYNELNESSSIFGWLFNLSGINTHLTHLDLSQNQLAGPLSSDFGNLQALSYLDLSMNEFQGSLPGSFGNMQSLSYLDLSGNGLQGSLPSSFGNIKSLAHVDLSWNSLQSLPKTLGNLCSLQELDLRRNNITDELSYIIQSLSGCASKSLLSIDLSDNKIQGLIPELIGIFSSLRELDLSNNQLNGRIPQSLQLSMMETLDLSFNQLEGTLSNSHFSNLLSLRDLSLGENLGLALDINDDVDWVPPFQLDVIDLSSCKVGPLFPKWLLSQTNCSYLDISNAGIFDSIPEIFWNSLPSKLHNFNMSHNKIYGTIPNLSNLQLNSDRGYDTIEVDLSFNNFEGAIPSFPCNITSLLLNNNNFTNPTPFMCPKSKIQLSNLDLSNNLLSGKLSDCCWMNFPRLSILHIENNNFFGAIPSSIGHLKHLQALHLGNNIISGDMPRSLLNLTSLVILDLAHNSLSGHIPPSIGNSLRSLGILSLQSNDFDGKIPFSLCQMSFLQVLDLSSNHIFGTIPKCIKNFTAMQDGTNLMPEIEYLGQDSSNNFVDAATLLWKRKEWIFKSTLGLVKAIDISNNELDGEIPKEFSFLKGLDSLNLSRNNLIGAISPELGQLTALQTLDLSENKISGEVPTSFFELNSLGILDLSNNHLTGKIPDIPQLQRFDASSYVGNLGLCGQPLPKCPWDNPHDSNPTKGDDANNQDANDSDDIFTVGLYISVTLGFIIGFWGVCGTLVLKRSWRHAFFQFLDEIKDKFNVKFSMILAKCLRRQ